MKFNPIVLNKTLRSGLPKNNPENYVMMQVTITFPVMKDNPDLISSVQAHLECAACEVYDNTDPNSAGWIAVSSADVTKRDLQEFSKKNPDWFVYAEDATGNEEDFLLAEAVKTMK
jgi:hypothetical protein